MMHSQRVDTASNVSQFSRMNRSGYSARHILNKSGMTGMTSDVSDTSFSMFMYVPKKDSGASQTGSKKTLADDEQSYEYNSLESKSNKYIKKKNAKKKKAEKSLFTNRTKEEEKEMQAKQSRVMGLPV